MNGASAPLAFGALGGLVVVLSLIGCEAHELAVFDAPLAGGGAAGAQGAASAGASGAGGSRLEPSAAGTAGEGVGGSSGAAGSAGAAGLGGSGGNGGAAGSAGSGGEGGTPGGTTCSKDLDCVSGWRCEKPNCDAELGKCEPPVVFIPPDLLPVCGCDGVTYWNDAVRRQAGAAFATAGECRSTACACEVGSDCLVPFASCSHVVPGDTCGHGTGACWVLPPQCPPGDAKVWQACKPPEPGAPPAPCLDLCSAIASEKAYGQPHHGEMCQ